MVVTASAPHGAQRFVYLSVMVIVGPGIRRVITEGEAFGKAFESQRDDAAG
jgi:hypothetical protein